MRMKAVVIGSGRIGCGFAGQLLRASGMEVVFAARSRLLVAHLNRVRQYRVRLVKGTEAFEITVNDVRAVSTAERDRVAAEIAEADLVATAVGAGSLPDIAPLIAAGLRRRTTPLNVIAFENLTNAGSYLRAIVTEHLPAAFPVTKHGFSGALVSRAVTERLGDPAGDEPLSFVGDPPSVFVVDGTGLCEPLPAVTGMIVTDNFPAWIKRKLFTYSAGHATAAYLGHLKGYHYIHTAIRDPEIRVAVLSAMAEGQRALAARYGPDIAGGKGDLRDIIARFDNAALNDPVTRVGRDPRRKLGADDRLVGAARLAEEVGVRPEKLALAAAAAFYFDDPADPTSTDFRREVEKAGLSSALSSISGLDCNHGLGRAVADRWGGLGRGWRRGNLLLSLDRLLWAWKTH